MDFHFSISVEIIRLSSPAMQWSDKFQQTQEQGGESHYHCHNHMFEANIKQEIFNNSFNYDDELQFPPCANFPFHPVSDSSSCTFPSFLQSNSNPLLSSLLVNVDPSHEYHSFNLPVYGSMGMVDSGNSYYDAAQLLPPVEYGGGLDCFQGSLFNTTQTMISLCNSPQVIENVRCNTMVAEDKGKAPIEDSALKSDSEEHYPVDLNANANVSGKGMKADKYWRRKGQPATNLMSERRRRHKLNHKLYMLRSIVPNISKMDRVSILADAIDYTNELLQRINQLNKQVSLPVPASSSSTSRTSQHAKSYSQSSSPNQRDHPPTVDVEVNKDGCFDIHMLCGRRPTILSSTMSALDNIGVNAQNVVISSFNGFSMDVFGAQEVEGDVEIHGDRIREALMDVVA